jgi:hypothetical protein
MTVHMSNLTVHMSNMAGVLKEGSSYPSRINHHVIEIKFDRFLNVREIRSGNQEWTLQRYWQHWAHKTQDEEIHGPCQRPG